MSTKKHTGGCHCGAVKYEAELDAAKGSRCNCTICTKTMSTNAMTKPELLRVTKGEDALSIYEWGAKISKRFFCKFCGIHVFGRGFLEEIGGAYASINLNTLDDIEPTSVKLQYWDGRHDNWQAGPRAEPFQLA